jgi:hypothetical protein
MILFYAAPRPPACMHIQSRQPPARRHLLISVSSSHIITPIYARAADAAAYTRCRLRNHAFISAYINDSVLCCPHSAHPLHIQSRQPPAHANPRRPPASSNCGMHYPIPAAITIHPVSSEMMQTISINLQSGSIAIHLHYIRRATELHRIPGYGMLIRGFALSHNCHNQTRGIRV